ncbi:MAG: RRQRL motif-containing zinc-binding protein [Pseudonocardia sp.]
MTKRGVMTERWGWQPTAWIESGVPTWRWRAAPGGLVTRRQMRAAGLAPGGAAPVARVVCRRGRRWAWLYDAEQLVPKRVPSAAQLDAVAAALAVRRRCPSCGRDVGYCVPTSLGECVGCHEGRAAA